MKITKKQVRLLEKQSHNGQILALSVNLRMWFPKAFEDEKPSLEVGKWYKHTDGSIIFRTGKSSGYGVLGTGEWAELDDFTFRITPDRWTLATHTEVYNALTKEALKRGFKEYGKQSIKPIDKSNESGEVTINADGFSLSNFNRLRLGHTTIFDYGEWAEVVQTITKEEAEKQLGKKIV